MCSYIVSCMRPIVYCEDCKCCGKTILFLHLRTMQKRMDLKRFFASSECELRKPVLIFSNEQSLLCKLHFDVSKLLIFKQNACLKSSVQTVCQKPEPCRAKLVPRRGYRTKSIPPDSCLVSFFPTWLGVRWKCILQCSRRSYTCVLLIHLKWLCEINRGE